MDVMTSSSTNFGRLITALYMAFVISFAGLTPGHGLAGELGHTNAEISDFPCEKSVSHKMHVSADSVHMIDDAQFVDDCCEGAFCSGDTVRACEMTLSGAVYEIAFVQVPSDALRHADPSLPHRPPRYL
ncbi:hypothetical protein [Roseibium sp.]|uniref:hypothetical protein n=1 Tax=Roseibium sp. TaxID=1936156 RepID=UPI003D0F8105